MITITEDDDYQHDPGLYEKCLMQDYYDKTIEVCHNSGVPRDNTEYDFPYYMSIRDSRSDIQSIGLSWEEVQELFACFEYIRAQREKLSKAV